MVLPKLSGLSLAGRLPNLSPDAGSRLALGMFGPMVAAVLMRLFVSREGLKGSLGLLRPLRFYLIAIGAPALFIALLILVDGMTGLGHFRWTERMPLPLAYAMAAIINGAYSTPLGFAEEYGWRGYLLPRLLPMGEAKATVIVGLVWAGWHVPAIIIGLNYPGEPLWAALLVFAATAVAIAFPFTWLFLASGRSVLVVGVMHAVLDGLGDPFTSPARMPGASPLIAGAGGLVTAVLLLLIVGIVYGPLRRRTNLADLRNPPVARQGKLLDWIR